MQTRLKPIVVALALALAANQHTVWAADETPSGEPKATGEMGVTEMSPIQVRGVAGGGYVAKRASSGTKTNTPILETPMAVQVVPHEVIEDRQIQTSIEAVKNLSGVQAQPGTFYDQFMIRGFASGYGVTFRNGLQMQGVKGAIDMAFVDRIEVAKGPTGVLYGQIQPGGLVNVVTKKPQAQSAFSVQQQVGDWNTYRTTADATGKMNESGSALYRVIGVYDKGDSWVDYAHHDNKNLATYFAFKPSDRLDVNFDWEHYDTKQTNPGVDGAVPVIGNRPANLPRNFSANDPVMWSNFPYTVKRDLLGLDWTYAINDQWKLTNRFQYIKIDEHQDSLGISSFNGVNAITGRRFVLYSPYPREETSTNLDLTGEFQAGAIKHKLLVGLDWFHYRDTAYGRAGVAAGLPAVNIFNPAPANLLPILQPLADQSATNRINGNRTWDSGVYVQDQLSIGDKWEILLGGRKDIVSRKLSSGGLTTAACYPNCNTPYVDSATLNEFAPRAGLLYKLSSNVSIYGSYSESFGTNNGFDATGKAFDPQKGKQYELGAKANLFDGKVTTSATLFDLYLQNVLTPNLANPLFSITAGEVESKGIEFDISGQVTKNVSLIGSYTYDSAVITKDNITGVNAIQGKDWAGVPKNAASLWAKYDTAPGEHEGWAYGAGIYLNGQRQGNNTNTYQLPGYSRIDAMVSYRTKAGRYPLTAQLNVKNVFDKWYFEATDGGTSAYYGAPRTVTASVKVDF